MICNRCNHKLPEDSEFCQYCGNKIEKINAVSAENTSIVQDNSMNPLNNEKESRKQKVVKTRYCSFCGMVIDSESKKCTGCGKQYFNGIKINKLFVIILLAILLMSSVILNAIQMVSYNEDKKRFNECIDKNNRFINEINNLQVKLNNKEMEISRLTKEVERQKELVEFIDKNVVYKSDNITDLYHKFDCYKFDRREDFRAYDTKQAVNKGLRACDECHNILGF